MPNVLTSLTLLSVTAAHIQNQIAACTLASRPQKRSATRAVAKLTLTTAQRKKIRIDLSRVDRQGLRGPEDGKVSIGYLFAVPNTQRCRDQVHRLDPTTTFLSDGYRRGGGHKGQSLCLGNTHQPHWRTILYRLAALPYVKSIVENFYEQLTRSF